MRSEPANYVTNNSEREEDFTIAVRRTPAGLRALIGHSFQRVEIAVLRVATAVAVPAMVPCVGPHAGGTRVYVDELALGVVTDATGAQ